MAQIILDSNNNLIQGDFDNATINNRTKFKTTTTNATTNVYAVPNGSATSAGFTATNAADPTNASKITIATNGSTDTQIISGVNGSGTYLPLSFYTNNALAMQVDTAGNVGVGVTPSSWESGASVLQFNTAGAGGTANDKAAIWCRSDSMRLISGAYFNGTNYIYNATGVYPGALNIDSSNGSLSFANGATGTGGNTASLSTKFTIDSSGQLVLSNTAYTTAEGIFTVNGNSCGGYIGAISNRNTSNCAPAHGLIFRAGYNGSSSNSNFFSFRRPDDSVLGSITQNGASNISYATSSDYRLKENIIPLTGALETVAKLNPVNWTWKTDGSDGQGFIAHELQAVIPDAVTGEKDAVDAEGNPQYQGVDTSFLVATLTAAIKEQQAIINELKTRIEALENK